MMKCFKCQELHVTSQALISHLKFKHGFYPTSKQGLMCSQETCRKQFVTYSGFRKHLENTHVVNNTSADCSVSHNSPPSENISEQMEVDLPEVNNPVSTRDISENRSSVPSTEHLNSMCASIIAKLQGGGASNNLVSAIVGDLEEFTTEMHDHLKHSALSVLPSNSPGSKEVEQSFEYFQNPFSFLNSESKRVKYFREKWGTVEPLELTLGVRFDTRRNKTLGTYDQVQVRDTFVYIPILETLKFMFCNSDICEQVIAGTTSSPHTYEDFKDGSYFKKHTLFSKHKNALQIQVYYDDFETANPLGSKHSIHKLGCLYFILRNLPPKFNSAILNIHLVSLFHSQDVKKYGFDAILEPLIRDIRTLEIEGIDLPISCEKVYGTISQIIGDNLGIHAILGYNESFSSTYYCRLCMIDKMTAQTVYSEDHPSVVVRDVDSFERHCRALHLDPQLKSVYGLKRDSTLNTLKYFHVVNNVSVDIMHDLLEGVAQFELKLLFQHLKWQWHWTELNSNILPCEEHSLDLW